jgi:hypothetical protein
MRNLLQRHPQAFGLAVVAAILAVVIALEAGFGVGLLPTTTAPAAKPAVVADAKLVPPMSPSNPDQAFPETASRPLFTPTRRPAPAAPSGANTMVKGQFILQGVMGVGGLQIALLREKSNGRVHRVEKGKDVNGVTLSSVEHDKVVLSQGGDQETLTLAVQKAPAGPPVPGAPVPAQAAAAAAGPFGPSGPAPGAHPAQPPVTPPTAAAPAQHPGAGPVPNPATRSGFGPFQPPPQAQPQAGNAATGADQATPLTPEELLARRRARRQQQQQPNQ